MDSIGNKYKFNDVLVADTKLLVPLESKAGPQQPARGQPEVLVLNSKLYNCDHPLISSKQPADCSSCCLQIERPEFRRRVGAEWQPEEAENGDEDYDGECFANCSKRRAINVELRAANQLSGKLVILALSRTEHLFSSGDPIVSQQNSNQEPAPIAGCLTQATWAFVKFEPNGLNQQQQVHYSRLTSKQAPSLYIDSAEIHWDATERKQLVLINIRPTTNNTTDRTSYRINHRGTKRKEYVKQETLLVTELKCKLQSFYNLTGGRQVQVEDGDDATDFRVHLLTLINRNSNQQLTPQSASAPPLSVVQAPKASGGWLPPTGSVMIADSGADPLLTSSGISILPPSRLDSAEVRLKSLRSTETETVHLTRTGPNLQPKKYEFKANESANMGPAAYLDVGAGSPSVGTGADGSSAISSTDLLLQRMRLKSAGGLLVLAVSSGFVILTYTLCLLAYLKWRHKFRPRSSSCVAGASKDNRSQGNAQVIPIRSSKLALDSISPPYNLQMPPATRTRLEMMLRSSLDAQNLPAQPSTGRDQQQGGYSFASWRKQRGQNLLSALNQVEFGDICSRYGARGDWPRAQRLRGQQPAGDQSLEGQPLATTSGGNSEPSSQPIISRYKNSFGSINVVRAIRQGVTLARSRIQLSRYRPKLNVIPESDLEQLQSPNGKKATAEASSSSPDYYAATDSLDIEQTSRQLDTQYLVQEALSNECSHYVDRGRRLHNNNIALGSRQATETLFAKPITNNGVRLLNSDIDDPISRTQILKYVKRDDNTYERSYSESNQQQVI